MPRTGHLPWTRKVAGDRGERQPVAGPVERQLRRGDFLLSRLQSGHFQRLKVNGHRIRIVNNPSPCVRESRGVPPLQMLCVIHVYFFCIMSESTYGAQVVAPQRRR